MHTTFFCLPDNELLHVVVKVEHVSEVWREQVWDATLVEETFWVALDYVWIAPFNFLTLSLLASCRLSSCVPGDIDTSVDLSNEVIDDLHHFCLVLAQVKSLLEVRSDVPVKFFQFVVLILLRLMNHIEKEVEEEFAFICMLIVVFLVNKFSILILLLFCKIL